MPLNKIHRGEIAAFPGATWNTLVDNAKAKSSMQPGWPGDWRGLAVEIKCQNVSDEDIPLGGVLRIDGVAEVTNATVLRVAKPNEIAQPLYVIVRSVQGWRCR